MAVMNLWGDVFGPDRKPAGAALFADDAPKNEGAIDLWGQVFPKPRAAKSGVPEKPRGVVSEVASSLGAGVVSTLESVAGTMEMAGVPGADTAVQYWKDLGESEALRRPEYLKEGTVLEKPERLADWRWWVRSLGENLPNLAAMMLPGVGAMRAAQAAGWGMKAVRGAALAGSWSGSMTIEAGSAYNSAKEEMREAGQYDDETIERVATLEGLTAGTVNSLIELAPFEKLFLNKGVKKLLGRFVRQAFWEGGTEGVQEEVNVLVEKMGHKPDLVFTENFGRIIESAIIGAGLGGIAGGAIKSEAKSVDSETTAETGMEAPGAVNRIRAAFGLKPKESMTTGSQGVSDIGAPGVPAPDATLLPGQTGPPGRPSTDPALLRKPPGSAPPLPIGATTTGVDDVGEAGAEPRIQLERDLLSPVTSETIGTDQALLDQVQTARQQQQALREQETARQKTQGNLLWDNAELTPEGYQDRLLGVGQGIKDLRKQLQSLGKKDPGRKPIEKQIKDLVNLQRDASAAWDLWKQDNPDQHVQYQDRQETLKDLAPGDLVRLDNVASETPLNVARVTRVLANGVMTAETGDRVFSKTVIQPVEENPEDRKKRMASLTAKQQADAEREKRQKELDEVEKWLVKNNVMKNMPMYRANEAKRDRLALALNLPTAPAAPEIAGQEEISAEIPPATTPPSAPAPPSGANPPVPGGPSAVPELFAQMPDEALRQQAESGVQGAMDELARRTASPPAGISPAGPVELPPRPPVVQPAPASQAVTPGPVPPPESLSPEEAAEAQPPAAPAALPLEASRAISGETSLPGPEAAAGPIEQTDLGRLVLSEMKSQLDTGEAGGVATNAGGEAIRRGSGYPDWFRAIVARWNNIKTSPSGKREGLSAADAAAILGKVLDGKTLTERQALIWNDLRAAAEDEASQPHYWAIEAEMAENAEEFPAPEIPPAETGRETATEGMQAPPVTQGVASLGAKPKATTPAANKYLKEQINYGGEIRSRGSVMVEMQGQGIPQKQIDAYMMGAKTVTPEEGVELYSAEASKEKHPALKPGEVNDLVGELVSAVKGIEARQTETGGWVIKTKNGKAVSIAAVDQITPSEIEIAALERDYGVKFDTARAQGKRIAGGYTPKQKLIRLVKSAAGSYTITHEFEHFLEDIGAITKADILVLRAKIRNFHATGKLGFAPANADLIGGPEDRAQWIARQITGIYDAKTVTGKIIQKVKEIVDRIVNALGDRTAAGAVRDIKTGKVFENKTGSMKNVPGKVHEYSSTFPLKTKGTDQKQDIRFSLEDLPDDTAENIRKAAAELPPETKAQAAATGMPAAAGKEETKTVFAAGTAAAAGGENRRGARPAGPSGPIGRQAEVAWDAAFGPAAAAVHRGVASLGAGRGTPEQRTGLARFKQHWKEFWSPFSTVPEGKQALAARYKSMGDVAKAMRFLETLHVKLDTLPDDVKKDMFRYLDGQIPLEVLPSGETRRLAEQIRQRTRTIGLAMVERGILKQEQFDAYDGRYIHYMYAYHVLGGDAKPGSIAVGNNGKLNLTETMRRNPNLTMEQRKALGLIEDASIAVPVGMGKALTDIAKWDYLQAISQNPEWVWQPSFVDLPLGKPKKDGTLRTIRLTIGKLADETRTYERMAKEHPSPEVEARYKILKGAFEKSQEETKNIPEDFVQLSDSKHYGPLAGAYVRKPIADDLKPVLGQIDQDTGKLARLFWEIEQQSVAMFKMGKVALNFPTAFRNVISNIIQQNMRGRSLPNVIGDIIKGLESYKAKDTFYEEAYGMGLFHSNWFTEEIGAVLDEFKKAKSGKLFEVVQAVRNVAKHYGRIDDFAKLAIFRQMRESGASVDEAALEGMKWGMDYSLASRSVKGLRRHIIPFACVDEQTEILTKRGWMRHTDLKNNDIALSLDLKDSCLKWQFISDVYRSPYDGDLLHFKDRNLDMMLTPDHKCIVYESKQKNYKKWKEYNLKYAHSLNTHSKIPVAGQYDQFPAQSRISDALVQIIGWVVTEGHYKKNTAQVCISQNEGTTFDKIKRALDQEYPGGYLIQRIRKNQMVFHIHAEPGRHIRHYVLDKQLDAEFILSLTKPQLELLIETMIDGDGSRRKNNRWSFTQNKNQTMDMFQMALVLSGISHGRSRDKICQVITNRQKKHYCMKRTQPEKVHYTGTIWCPSVPGTGTWVARRNGRVFLTGNTYQYKIAPLIAESLAKRPWVIAKYLALPAIARAAAMGLNDLDDDDWDKLEKQLPAYIKKSGSVIVMPWKNDKGQWQWVNTEYFMPFGNWMNAFRDVATGDAGEFLQDTGVSHPLMDLFNTFRTARDGQPPVSPWMGKTLYNELDTPTVKAAKVLEHIAFTFAPSMLSPSFGALGHTIRAARGGEDRWGKEVSLPMALGRWFGVNVTTVSPEQTAAIASVKLSEMHKELARIKADPRNTDEEKAAAETRMREKIAEIAEKTPDAVMPISKQKGVDPVYNALVEMVRTGALKSAPPSRSVQIAGISHKMTIEQYRQYLEKSTAIAHPRLQRLLESDGWKKMNDKRRGEVVSAIIANARKGARQKIKIEIAKDIKTKGEKNHV